MLDHIHLDLLNYHLNNYKMSLLNAISSESLLKPISAYLRILPVASIYISHEAAQFYAKFRNYAKSFVVKLWLIYGK